MPNWILDVNYKTAQTVATKLNSSIILLMYILLQDTVALFVFLCSEAHTV